MTRKSRPAPFDGALVIDKPRGQNLARRGGRGARDCSASARSAISARSIRSPPGYWCCCSAAPRASRNFSGRRKRYRSTFRFGFATDTYDADGAALGPDAAPALDRAEIERLGRAPYRTLPADAAAIFGQENSWPPGARIGAQE